MTNEELEKLRADLADLDARRVRDHDDPMRLANPLVAMFDEATVRKLLDALDESRADVEAMLAAASGAVGDDRGMERATPAEAIEAVVKSVVAERDEARSQLAGVHAAVSAVKLGLDPDESHLLAEINRLRAQLAALHAEVSVMRKYYGRSWAWTRIDTALADLATAAADHERRIRADERARTLRDDPIALAYGIASREASGPQLGEVYRRPDGGTMEVVEIKRGSWRWCVYRSETGETHERTHHPSWRLVDEAEKVTR